MRGREIKKLGIPGGLVHRAQKLCGKMSSEGMDKDQMRERLSEVSDAPEAWMDDPILGQFAEDLYEWRQKEPRDEPVDYQIWGDPDEIDPEAISQLEDGCKMPPVQRGAIMPDAHRGYNVPIGGVVAAEEAIMPGAVGVDIGCMMGFSLTSLRADEFDRAEDDLADALEDETAFGRGSHFEEGDRRDHPVMEDEDWGVSSFVKNLKDLAWTQLGSSGSGNHFAEWGIVHIGEDNDVFGVEPGRYVALLSHSGSRGPGFKISNHYVSRAANLRPELPDKLSKLAWLKLDSHLGQEFLRAMNLAGRFASACHQTLHESVLSQVDQLERVDYLENKHNFAWVEEIDGKTMVVHRKGATPAHEGELGVIPGTMVDPAFIVRGKGNEESLFSSSHGAGRVMSRTEAKEKLSESDRQRLLEENDVRLLSSGIDESPQVYKDIREVMSHQRNLVEPVARFDPRIVKMADPDEKSWESEEEE